MALAIQCIFEPIRTGYEEVFSGITIIIRKMTAGIVEAVSLMADKPCIECSGVYQRH